MTTAHRPTWKAAVGRSQEGGWGAGGAVSTQRSALDAPAHTKLKTRDGAQAVDRRAALAASLRKLEEAERRSGARAAIRRGEIDPEEERKSRQKLLEHDRSRDVDEEALLAKYDDADDDRSDDGAGGWSDIDDGAGGGGTKVAAKGGGSDLDASDSDLDGSSDDDSSDDDDSDDSDDEAALQAELAKIRAEREAARAKEEEEVRAEEEARMEEAALTGNPLLNAAGGEGGGAAAATASAVAAGGRMKRRWNDDVVFRNQAKGEPDQNKKRFINDTVRNDFHKRFLNKFIK